MSDQRRFDRTRRVYELDSGLSDEDKRYVGNHVLFTMILTTSKNGRGSAPTIQKEFMKACQDPQWNLDVSTHHRSEKNGVAGRAVRTVKIGTAVELGQSGLPEEWRDCAIGLLVSMYTI